MLKGADSRASRRPFVPPVANQVTSVHARLRLSDVLAATYGDQTHVDAATANLIRLQFKKCVERPFPYANGLGLDNQISYFIVFICVSFFSIRDLDPVPSVYQHQCERLLLAQNYIALLHGVSQFTRLTHLSLSHNAISDLRELQYLRPLGDTLVALR